MIFTPIPLTDAILSSEQLKKDVRNAKKIGPCGIGEQALYLGGRFIERRYYILWRRVRRVFKRVAMTKGGFTKKGLFASMTYIVVQYDDNSERTCYIKREADADILLELIQKEQPKVAIYSAEAQKKLKAAEKEEAARYKRDISPEAHTCIEKLEHAIQHLNTEPTLYETLVASAKQKRIADGLKPSYRAIGIGAVVGGFALLGYGLYRVSLALPFGWYIVVFGVTLIFTAMAANIAPSKWNSRRYAQKNWLSSVQALEKKIAEYGDFPLPPHYAHPVVLERMIRVIKEGRASSDTQALEEVKKDLKALNASVSVSQKEYNEVVTIKPFFLIAHYENTLD